MSSNRERSRETHPLGALTVVGRHRVALSTALEAGWAPTEVDRRITFRCASGQRIGATWTGFPTIPVLEPAEVPGGTTHLVFESNDGQAGCVTVREATRGLLAIARNGERLNGPRFVAPGLAGPRAVKDVRRIVATELKPGETRDQYETTSLESQRSGDG